ncbi:MAG: metallophosphoesterase [Erysipelotrichaceae bacterium]|nr:metallophosphoesterase [Erysipelotrichaceae bacterium]
MTKYQLVSDKNVNDMHIVFISDLHLGYNVGLIEIEDMVETINKLKPDIVLIGGDIFDNEFGSIEEPEMMSNLLSSIDSKYGVFTCLGNHDVDEKIFYGFTFKQENVSISDEMLDFLAKSNIKLLYEDYICVGDYIIYGRPDYERINLNNNSIKSISNALCNIDKDKYLIVLDHEPRFMNEYSNNNVDLLLNGHTHNGQIWPGTITIKLFWDNCYGYKKYQDMDNIVSSGVGLYGVNMRIGTIAEICDIYISSN